MNLELTIQFQKDCKKLKKENKKLFTKLLELMLDIADDNSSELEGIGKPEMLRGNLSGCYSRRIDSKHRLIYKYDAHEVVTLISCYGHYSDK